jgi:hypothetical protein
MQFEFATKRNPSGNRYYLGIDTDARTFSRDRARWYSREDITEISKKDRAAMIEKLERAGYAETDLFFPKP